jgi:hypothetical protein
MFPVEIGDEGLGSWAPLIYVELICLIVSINLQMLATIAFTPLPSIKMLLEFEFRIHHPPQSR